MSTDRDRVTAARLLVRVETGAWASRLLAGESWPGVRARVLGVLRWLRLLDWMLDRHSRRPVGRLDAEVRAVLRIGLMEVLELGVPAPVAVDGAVRAVRSAGRPAAAGLVNAVLRRATADVREGVPTGAPPDLRLSHPAWLAARWSTAFGARDATEAMAADQRPAAVWVWFRDPTAPGTIGMDDLRRHPWCPDAWTSEAPRPLLAAAAAGAAVVQDPASQLAAHFAAALAPPAARLADLCAAPGGKTALTARLADPGRVVAADRHLGRAARMAAAAAEEGAKVVAADAVAPPLHPGAWDLVMVDAPCSGTGTLRRHPELKWTLDEAAIREAAVLQRDILAGALPLLAPRGVLLYTTCSVEPEENERLFDPPPAGLEPVPLEPLLPDGTPARPTPVGGVRVLPGDEWDGFTYHAWRRVSTGRAE